MQRNIRNEIYMALGALIIISFALVFAILLSNSVQEGDATATPVTEVANNTETVEATERIVPSDTDTPEPIPSDTETPTKMLTIETETIAIVESATPTLIQLGTENTTVAPTSTHTVTFTASPTETTTTTSTSTDEVTSTLTLIRLDTALAPVTSEVTDTVQASPSPTNTSVVSSTLTAITGIIPTPPPSPTIASPDEPTRTPASCQKPKGWATYTVQAGNTLFAIALATNSTVDELRYVNCIENIDNIIVGDVLFVPRKPRQPIRTPAPAQHRNNLYAIGCGDARTKITNLQVAQTMNGVFNVYGSAFRDDFWYYKIEVRPDWTNIYNFFSRSEASVTNGVLTTINPKTFGEGVYWIRLSVVNRTAIIEADAVCEIPVIFG